MTALRGAATQFSAQVSIVKKNHEMDMALINMVDQVARSAPPPKACWKAACILWPRSPGVWATYVSGPSQAVIWQQEKTDRAVAAVTFRSEIARNFFTISGNSSGP